MINKRTKILGSVSGAILILAIGFRVFDGQSTMSAEGSNAAVLNNNSSIGNNKDNNKIMRIPPAGHISQSIDELARQIVANAPNQQEAFSFLVEAQSLRIQTLQARRAKERADESKSNYDAELWDRKIVSIDEDIAKDLEKGSVETQPGKNRIQQQYGRNAGAKNNEFKAPKSVQLSDFTLRAIIKDDGKYVARISYRSKVLPAKEGYKLLGKVNVNSITSSQVELSKGNETLMLYAH